MHHTISTAAALLCLTTLVATTPFPSPLLFLHPRQEDPSTQLPAPQDWVDTVTNDHCDSQASITIPLAHAANRGPSSVGGCADDKGLKRSLPLPLSTFPNNNNNESPTSALTPRNDPDGSFIPAQQVCTWMYLGLAASSPLGDTIDTASMVVEAGKEVLLSWAFDVAVDHILVWVTQPGKPQTCFAWQTIKGLAMGYTRFKKERFVQGGVNGAFYHFQFVMKAGVEATKGRVGAWKRAGL